ncbi:MAG: pseudouridine synthase [Bacteriovoracaceae bacterium]
MQMSDDKQSLIRLQKYIADSGITSRRKAEELMLEGRVTVNGKKWTQLGSKINPQTDAVCVDGDPIDPRLNEKVYLVFHKPRGVITSVSDPEGRKTVLDFVSNITSRIYPVGRLDYLSEGLLLMTNDGELAQQISHPSYRVPKVYEVKVFGHVDLSLLKAMKKGVQTEVGKIRPESVRVIKQLPSKTWLEIRLMEGKNREIRRLCDAFNITIDKLKRVAIGNLSIQGIKPGSYDMYSKKQLLKAIGINESGEFKASKQGFFSAKKTVKIKEHRVSQEKLANQEKYGRYKKEAYYDSLKAYEAFKEKQALKEKMERKAEREAYKQSKAKS